MKGICFIEPLFHATIDGGKTMTRRMIKHQPKILRHIFDNKGFYNPGGKFNYLLLDNEGNTLFPKYKENEIIYLKEPYFPLTQGYDYKYGKLLHSEETDRKWKNKLFMPAKAARYFIKIINVRAEMLQDISEVDCAKEGIEFETAYKIGLDLNKTPRADYRAAYADLIDKINGKGTWKSNPWVWVYEYELLKDYKYEKS